MVSVVAEPHTVIHFDGSIFHRQPHGGITRVFRNLIRELSLNQKLSLKVHLWKENLHVDLPESATIHQISECRSGLLHRLGLKAGLLREAVPGQKYFGALEKGIFHSTYYSTFHTPNQSQVLTLHDMIFEDFPECFPDAQYRDRHIRDKQLAIEAADVIVCDSVATKERLLARYGKVLRNRPVEVVYLGIDSAILSPAQSRPVVPEYVLHVGSRHLHKNFDRLIQAMGQTPLRNLHLLSIGGGNWSPREQCLIDQHCSGRGHCIPRATDQELASAYHHATAVVIPSLSEGFGLPVLEAMSHTIRIACSTGGSLSEVGGEIPFYFDPLNVEEMAHCIAAAASRMADRELEARASAHVKKFSWEETARQYAELYSRFGKYNGLS